MPLLLGLFSWIFVGLVAGLAAARLFPGSRRLGAGAGLGLGLGGAIAGGLLATYLGFGGLAGYDPRALVVATLASALTLLTAHFLRQPTRG